MSEWRLHQKLLSAFSCYQAHGAFAYFSNQKKIYARFNWKQISSDRCQLILTNPLGKTEINLDIQSGSAKLIDNHGKCYTEKDAEMIIQKLSGISIPLINLRQWMLGLPGDATNFDLDSNGYLHALNYNYNGQCWTVIYKSYYDDIDPALPSNLELYQCDIQIKLRIDKWNL
ncbi:Outer-membrane lipoprotein LolB precursor [Candidatus Gullanella endobia]|uniref:Outer-membrane lipoprotein LolB n=1 Tax=Candidatus Gullanella endobia TaxID=1070130 RepID=A0A143WQ76_9ENTR|nr:lipoprotein insertase outer membrane protein LolB [Candidatus Gullanella endobia]CUX95878.1 Outer-membrane lipoprotein LolB precursor [Candidatus Gullanella endobia]